LDKSVQLNNIYQHYQFFSFKAYQHYQLFS